MKTSILIAATLIAAACARTSAAEGQSAPASSTGLAAAASATFKLKKPLPPGAIILQRGVIPDPGIIGQGPAFYVMLPAGWTGRGGVEVSQRLCAEPFGVKWSAASADGRSSVVIFPTEVWQSSNTGLQSDCTPAAYTNVRDYLAARAGQMFPGARVLDYRQRNDFAKAAQERAQIMTQMFAGSGLQMRAWADGGEVLFAYTQNGGEMRGVIGASSIFYGNELNNPMGGEPLRTLTGATVGTFGAVAPEGQLDFTMIEAVRKSVTPDPRWLQAYFEFQVKLGKINAQATDQRAAMIVAGGAEATRQNIATYKAMASASIQNSRDSVANQTWKPSESGGPRELVPGDLSGDRIQRESIEAVRGVETYADPVAGGNVQLDATYDHAWRINNQDAYILTNDPNFNPGQYDIQATQMGAVQ
ncbi:MAG: hypothetical protein ACKVS5_14700 [Parvularculaceae bacterium]